MNKNIFVIDDDSSLRNLNAKILTDLGFKVKTANSGQNALALLKSGFIPDLIIVDFIMPGMDGIEFLKTLRSMNEFKDLPVILMTATNHPDLLSDVRTLKLAGLLIKPVAERKLIEKVESIFATR